MKILVQENKNDVVLIMIDHAVRTEYYFTHELWGRFRETIGAPTDRELKTIEKEFVPPKLEVVAPISLIHHKEGLPEL